MMERVTIVMALFNQIEMTTKCFQSLGHTREPFRVVVIDNGSTDGTREWLRRASYSFPIHLIENDDNRSVIASFNRAWPAVRTEFLCFLHNDTEMLDPEWLGKLLEPFGDPTIGMTGLFGAKRMRRDGRFVGRTIVHSLADAPSVRPSGEDVSVVDAVCMCLRRKLLEEIGGLDERYGFYHGFDKDLSLAVRERGLRCRVVHAPFHHHGGGTRSREFARDPARERRDLALRRVALDHLTTKWAHCLPADARTPGTRVREWLAARYPWRS